MRIIVADKRGIVASAARTGFLRNGSSVEIVTARNLEAVKALIEPEPADKQIVLSAELVLGLKTHTDLARVVKDCNRYATFVVYNGVVEEYGTEVDLIIPSYKMMGDLTVGQHIFDFLYTNVLRGVGGVQLPVL